MVLKIIKFVLDVFILCVSYFVPKKRNLTIYGEWFGLTANRETFSFYLNDASLYKKVWITKDINLYNKLRKQIEIHMAYSIRGLYLQLRAERFIVNVSSNDIARGVTVRAKEFILVGHGIPVKTFLLSEKRGILYTLLLKIKFLLFENYTTIFYPFQDFIDIYKKAYNSSVDVLRLFNPENLYPIVLNRNVSESFEIIYLPTHQNEGINYDYDRDQKFYEKICNLENVNLTVVLHPYEWKYLIEIQNKFNFNNITFTIQNPNDYIGKVNFAITDYSGSIYGYLYNKLPVVFFHNQNNVLLTRKFIKPPFFFDYNIVNNLNDLVSILKENISNEKNMIFEKIQFELIAAKFTIVSKDHNRPWGGFFVIAEEQAQEFSNQYFDGLEVSTLKRGGALSPKILVVAPEKRLSWQYHQRRAEIWRVIQGQVGVKRSANDIEGELEILNVGDMITLQKGERHRLIGLNDYAVIAEIWQHTDANHPSDEDDIVRVQDDFGR